MEPPKVYLLDVDLGKMVMKVALDTLQISRIGASQSVAIYSHFQDTSFSKEVLHLCRKYCPYILSPADRANSLLIEFIILLEATLRSTKQMHRSLISMIWQELMLSVGLDRKSENTIIEVFSRYEQRQIVFAYRNVC